MYNLIDKHPRRFALILSLFVFLLFASTTPNFNVGYGDSDEFLAVGKTWGLAHPPGYTLYTTMIHAAMNLPIPLTNQTQRAHLLSGVLSATGLFFTTLTLFVLTRDLNKKKDKQLQFFKITGIVVTTLTIATAKLYWIYSQITEKYILSAMLISIIMYLSTSLLMSKKSGKQLVWLSLFYGLLLAHHQSTVFLLPYFLFILFETRAFKSIKTLAVNGLFLLLGFILPLGLLLLRSNPGNQASWFINPGIKGVISFVTREDFRGNIYATNTSSSGYFLNKITLNQITTGLLHYSETLLISYSWWILIPLITTVLTLWIKDRKKLLSISLPLLLMGFALSAYLSWPNDLGSQAATVRFYIPSLITLSPLLCLGLIEMMDRLYSAGILLGFKKVKYHLLGIGFVLIPIIIAGINYKSVSIHKFDLISRLYKTILSQVEQDSIITCYSDSSCFALIYEQTVNNMRPDVDVVPLAYPLVRQKLQNKELNKFSYSKNPYLMLDIVTWNIGKRPVYAVDISRYYFSLYGIDNAFMYYIPQGYFGKLDRTMPATLPQYDISLSEKYTNTTISDSDLMQRYLIQSLSQTHLTNGYMLLRMGNRPEAQKELNTAVNMVYSLTESEKNSGSLARTQIERALADPKFSPGNSVIDSNTLLTYLPDLLSKNQNKQAFAVAQGAVIVDPTNIAARLELARLYEKYNDPNFSRIEYQNVLILDPQNQEAIQKTSLSN